MRGRKSETIRERERTKTNGNQNDRDRDREKKEKERVSIQMTEIYRWAKHLFQIYIEHTLTHTEEHAHRS